MISLTTILLISCTNDSDSEFIADNSLSLVNLPPNRWIKYHEVNDGKWWRKGHAGLAYDSTRGSLLVFGSDTHGEDWDNVIHEFIPNERKWLHHGIISSPDSYQVNIDGYPVAGATGLTPWAMHTYDGIDYDPVKDALVVVASPLHNPIDRKLPDRLSDPIWIYDLQTKNWSILKGKKGGKPGVYFGSATAYDTATNTLYICKSGLWELEITNEIHERIDKAPKCLHRTMAFDSWRRHLYVFGSYRGTATISRYNLRLPKESRNWEELAPGGDPCPPYSKVPVAFDEKNGVFLLVIDDAKNMKNSAPKESSTFIYNPDTNTYKMVNGARLPAIGMNFMMAWDKVHEVFFIVTGNREDGVSVWALRLVHDDLTSTGY